MSKIVEIIKKKWLRDTFLTILLIAIIFAIYYGVNIGIKNLNLKDIDTTADKIYSISEATETKLKNLDKKVTIELINMGNFSYILDFANKYTTVNSNISVERIDDISARPDLMNTYGLESTDSLIIVKSEEKETLLSIYDLYTYDYTTSEEIDLTEEKITNAIIEVTIENKPIVYFLEGHNNYTDAYLQIVKQDIEAESNEVKSLNILVTGSVPEDCNCLVITTLKEDLTEMETDKIIEYINNGGKILLLADPNVMGIDLANFNRILDIYGFGISNGILIEQDTSKMIYNSPEFIISEIEPYSAISGDSKMNLSICVIDAGKIDFKNDEELQNMNVSYTPLAQVSQSAFLRTNLLLTSLSKSASDEDASNAIVGALVTKTLENDKKSEMIVFSNAVFATNEQINISQSYSVFANKLCNNDDVVMNSVSYLTERQDSITIRKDSDSVTYNVTEQQHTIIMIIIFVVPVLIIIAGIVVWQMRRRKK